VKPCPCTRETRTAGDLIGAGCWKTLPEEVRRQWVMARTPDEKTEAARKVKAHAWSRRPKQQPTVTQAQLL
jgi:hypothetical protein